MKDITALTVLALICGLAAHTLKQLIAARRNDSTVTLDGYVFGNWPETMLGTICAVVLYLGLPEIAGKFPELAGTIGLGAERTVMSSFLAGYMSNSFADFLGGRAQSIAGSST